MANNNYIVVELRDAEGHVAGYAAGTAAETAVLASSVWEKTASPGSAVNTLKGVLTIKVQELRQQAEAGGVMVKGNVHMTDLNSQVKYLGILNYASLNREYTGAWSTLNNGFVTLDAAGVSIMCACVMAYIQMCYSWEQYIMDQINAATTVEQLQSINLTAGRPQGQLPPHVVSGLEAAGGAFGSGAQMGTSLTTSGVASAVKFKDGSSTPSIVGGTGAGSTATVSLAPDSNDTAGRISVAASGTIAYEPGSVIANVTFASAYSTMPFVVITGANLAAGSLGNMPFVTTSNTGFKLCVSNMAGLSRGTTYLFNYVIVA
jgi:Domain of unknown function (DUF4376)